MLVVNFPLQSAHVMAMAVQKLYPDAKVTIGPWIENGFYYDFDMEPLTDKDLKRIKKEMVGRVSPLNLYVLNSCIFLFMLCNSAQNCWRGTQMFVICRIGLLEEIYLFWEKKSQETKLIEEYRHWMNRTSWRFWKALRTIPSPYIILVLFLLFSVFSIPSMHVDATHSSENIDKNWCVDGQDNFIISRLCVCDVIYPYWKEYAKRSIHHIWPVVLNSKEERNIELKLYVFD